MIRPSWEIVKQFEQTLYREARLLDDENYDEWLTMLAPDLFYYMPGVETRFRRDDSTDVYHDVSRMAFYNDDIEMLKKRVARLQTGTAWSEDPATRFAHLITNIEVETTDTPEEYRVYSYFYVYRSRNERDEDTLVGRRDDIWRDENGHYSLVKRTIRPTWSLLLSQNLNVFL
jgi:ethylbenzene dioxygenase beta subunit